MAARTWAESYLSLLSAAVLGATATALAYFRNDIIACVCADFDSRARLTARAEAWWCG